MKYKLDEICNFINGGAWSDKEYVANGLPVLKVTNCKPKGFVIEGIDFLPITSATKYAKNRLQLRDVVIATVGSHPNLVDSAAGRSSIVNSLVQGFYLNQNAVCLRTKDNDILDQSYLGYHTKYRIFQHFIQMRGRGAANQMRIAISAIKAYEFDFPDIDVQRRIANILSAYDDLIENNQKQIKLLEEAARRLYKEWFVDLRFPGYEDIAIVEGVPEGWMEGTLGDIAIFKRGKTITKAQVEKGNVPVVAGGLEPAYYHNKSNTVAPVVTVSGSGANAGFSRLYHTDVFASDCSFADIETTPYLYFVYCYLKENKASLNALQKGAAQPHVYAKEINTMKLNIPAEEYLSTYCKCVSPFFEKIKALQKQIKLSLQTRDCLLPKLMSGEIEV
ncbi:MAG: restriction endonuclease subunit S [Acetatifactor sp.]|nr:restriction endonuclease subunit S [Acetatifactor sp.]